MHVGPECSVHTTVQRGDRGSPEGAVRIVSVGVPSIVKGGVRAVLDLVDELLVVAEVAKMSEVADTVSLSRADVVIVDTDAVEENWAKYLPELFARAAAPAPRVLVLITSPADSDLVVLAAAGVTGWVLKDDEPAHLVSAVQAVAAGHVWLSPPVARQVLGGHQAREAPRPEAAQVELLSARERSVLRLLAQGRSNPEIAQALVLAEPTVKTHVSRLLAKLALRNRMELVAFAFRSGLIK